MRKIVAIISVMLVGVVTLSAQSLGDILKGAASSLVDEVTGGKATELMLPGTWSYKSPALRLEGDDVLADVVAQAAVASVETKLEKVYSYVGIVSGACSFTFNSDDTFSMVLGKRTLTGKYIYDASTHKITLEFATSLLKLGSMTGYAYIDGQDMDIVFDCNKLYNFLTKLGSKVSALGGIMKITESYDGMMLGFSLSK